MAGDGAASVMIDPETRYPHVTWQVPADAPAEVRLQLRFQDASGGEWKPASVRPQMSHIAASLVPVETRGEWMNGTIIERQAAGEKRTFQWTPYHQIPANLQGDFLLRGELTGGDGKALGAFEVKVGLDNRDVIVINDFNSVLAAHPQAGITQVRLANGRELPRLTWAYSEPEGPKASTGEPSPDQAIRVGPPAQGRYAVHVLASSQGWLSIGEAPYTRLRKGGDGVSETSLGIHFIKPAGIGLLPMPTGLGTAPLQLAGLRLVPVNGEKPTQESRGEAPGKLIVGYFEPYSWAFWRAVRSDEDFLDVARIYKAAGIGMIDSQFGRFGSRLFFETERFKEDRFAARETQGDQTGTAGKRIQSRKVWTMMERSRPLAAMMSASGKTGLKIHANFGGTNAYPSLPPIQSVFSQKNPNLHRKRGNFLALGEPKVQEYMLGIYRETLELGAPGISIDFCRYPYGVDNDQQVTDFLRKLRALADGFTPRRTLLIRFPATGERRAPQYQYAQWIKEGLVDYLCPSNIFSTVLHFDPAPYIAAAKGSDCKVLPVMDTIPAGGFRFSEPMLLRARELYKAGADGIYLYQPDAHLFTFTPLTQTISLLGDPEKIDQALKEIEAQRTTASKGIFIEPPSHAFLGGYRSSNDRVRFWLEGNIGPAIEVFEAKDLVADSAGYPYVLGAEATDTPPPLSFGKHTIKVRAPDGEGWLEETFDITLVAPHQWD